MTESAEAVYYDGKSSIAYQVTVLFDAQKEKLFFHNESLNEQWDVSELKFEAGSYLVHIYNSGLPDQSLQFSDVLLAKSWLKQSGAMARAGIYQRLLHAGWKIHAVITVAITGFLLLAYFVFVPWIAEHAVSVLPLSYDSALGEQVFANFIQYEEVDSVKTELLREFAAHMYLDNDRKFTFTVVESADKNAFALPDGNIVVYNSIFHIMDSYEELAALISHEASHVMNRHSMRMLCRNLSGYLLISLTLSDVNGIMAVIADNANQLRMLTYSRNYERQADEDGWETLRKNKIAASGMLNLFTHLKGDENFKIPAFLSSHPLTNDRVNYINNLIRTKPFTSISHKKLEEIFTKLKEK